MLRRPWCLSGIQLAPLGRPLPLPPSVTGLKPRALVGHQLFPFSMDVTAWTHVARYLICRLHSSPARRRADGWMKGRKDSNRSVKKKIKNKSASIDRSGWSLASAGRPVVQTITRRIMESLTFFREKKTKSSVSCHPRHIYHAWPIYTCMHIIISRAPRRQVCLREEFFLAYLTYYPYYFLLPLLLYI